MGNVALKARSSTGSFGKKGTESRIMSTVLVIDNNKVTTRSREKRVFVFEQKYQAEVFVEVIELKKLKLTKKRASVSIKL